MSGKARVLLVHCDLGGAHRSVAEAISEELAGLADVQVVDLIAVASNFCNGWVRLYSSLLTRTPWFYNSIYDVTSQRIVWDGLYGGVLRRMMIKRVVELIVCLKPTCIVSLFPLTSRLVADATRVAGGSGTIRTAVFVVDLFSIHRAWAEPAADVMLVATGEAGAQLVSYGVAPDRIKVVRYPVRNQLRRLAMQTAGRSAVGEAAANRGAEPSREHPLVLLMGGGDGVLDMVGISRSILAECKDVEVIAVAGKNTRLRLGLERLAAGDHGRLSVSSHWSDVPGLMASADLLVTKPGPSTIMEAVEAELPILLTGFVPRQEEGNIRYVESTGLGMYSPVSDMGEAVRRSLRADELLGRKEAARHEKKLRSSIEPGDVIAQLISESRSGSISCDLALDDTAKYSTTYARI